MRKWYEMEACNQGPIIGGQVYLVRNIIRGILLKRR